jgi:hypothetical protein
MQLMHYARCEAYMAPYTAAAALCMVCSMLSAKQHPVLWHSSGLQLRLNSGCC